MMVMVQRVTGYDDDGNNDDGNDNGELMMIATGRCAMTMTMNMMATTMTMAMAQRKGDDPMEGGRGVVSPQYCGGIY